jgi:hypothetical protein
MASILIATSATHSAPLAEHGSRDLVALIYFVYDISFAHTPTTAYQFLSLPRVFPDRKS